MTWIVHIVMNSADWALAHRFGGPDLQARARHTLALIALTPLVVLAWPLAACVAAAIPVAKMVRDAR